MNPTTSRAPRHRADTLDTPNGPIARALLRAAGLTPAPSGRHAAVSADKYAPTTQEMVTLGISVQVTAPGFLGLDDVNTDGIDEVHTVLDAARGVSR